MLLDATLEEQARHWIARGGLELIHATGVALANTTPRAKSRLTHVPRLILGIL